MATIEKRTNPKGDISYRVRVRLKGFPAETATFERITDARRWAQQIEAAIREGRHFKTSEAKRRTCSEMIDKYIRDIIPHKPKNLSNRLLHLHRWKEELGAYSLSEVTPAVIAEVRDKLANEVTVRKKIRSSATVIRYLAALSHVFTIAVKEWGWIDDNPLRKVTKPKESRGRIRFLSDDERECLLIECKKSPSKYLYTAVVLALSTGGRHMEIMSIRWQDIDFSRSVITLHETKNGERRLLPLAGHALDLIKILAANRDSHCEFVFPSNDKTKPVDLRTPWETALKNANIHDFRWHDLRHSCASYLAMNNASLAEIAEILGHKTLQMVKRYSHLSDSHTSKVVASMNEKIFGI